MRTPSRSRLLTTLLVSLSLVACGDDTEPAASPQGQGGASAQGGSSQGGQAGSSQPGGSSQGGSSQGGEGGASAGGASAGGASAGGEAGSAGAAMNALDFEVDKAGPFNVGYRNFTHTYTPKGKTEPRTIVVHLWYPTNDTEGDNVKYVKVFVDDDVLDNAKLAPPLADQYPVIVYSHGYSGYAGANSDMMHHLASHGWVGVAPDHTGNTISMHTDKKPIDMSYLRPYDISAALDAVAALPSDDPLSGLCATDRVLMAGHSFGGYTTFATAGATFDLDGIHASCDAGTRWSEPCDPDDFAPFEMGLGDPRVVAAIPMAGGGGKDMFGEKGQDAIKIPVLFMTGSEDQPGGDGLFDRIETVDFTWLELLGGCHEAFTMLGCTGKDTAGYHKAINTYALSFGRKLLLGDTSARVDAILRGEEKVSDLVTFQRKNAPPK